MLIGSYWMPFSPRWLMMKGRDTEALTILEKMHAQSEDSLYYRAEFHQIKAQLELEKSEKVGVVAILKRPSYRKRVLLCVILMAGQQGTGIIPLQNYQVVLYESLGITNKLILILVGVWGTVTVLSTSIGSSLFDKMGRRKAFFISMWIILISSILLAAFWARYEHSGNTNEIFGRLAIFAMFLFLFGYAFIMNAFAYAYIPEILPTPIRATGVAISWAVCSGVIVMLVQVTPLGIERISWRYFMIFIFVDAIYMILVYWL
jgi:MFS family permease